MISRPGLSTAGLILLCLLGCNADNHRISNPILKDEADKIEATVMLPPGTKFIRTNRDEPPAAMLVAHPKLEEAEAFRIMHEALMSTGFSRGCISFQSISPSGVVPAQNAAAYHKATSAHSGGIVRATLVVWPDPDGSQVDLRLAIDNKGSIKTC